MNNQADTRNQSYFNESLRRRVHVLPGMPGSKFIAPKSAFQLERMAGCNDRNLLRGNDAEEKFEDPIVVYSNMKWNTPKAATGTWKKNFYG